MRIIIIIAMLLTLSGCGWRYVDKYWCMGLGGTWTEHDPESEKDYERPYCDLEGTLAR